MAPQQNCMKCDPNRQLEGTGDQGQQQMASTEWGLLHSRAGETSHPKLLSTHECLPELSLVGKPSRYTNQTFMAVNHKEL